MAKKSLIDEEKKIEKLERRILKEETTIEGVMNSSSFQRLMKAGEVLTGLHLVRHVMVDKIARHKFLFTLIIAFAVVLVWRGIWELTSVIPILSISAVALGLGLLILWLLEKYTDLH